MTPIRVLQIGLHTNRGGIESIVYSWWKNIPSHEVIFDFLNVWGEPIAFQDEFEAGGAKIIYKTLRKKNPIKSYEELYRIIKEGNYDYVHCHVMSLSEPEPIVIVNQLSACTKAIIHSHTAAKKDKMEFKRYLMHLYGRVLLKNCTYLKTACGTEAGRVMFKTDDFTLIENGIDRNKFKYMSELRNEIRKHYGIKETEFVIGHVGRPGKPKNYPFLIKVFQKFSSHNKARLILIGDIENDKEIQNLIDNHGVRANIICTGKVKDVYKYYSAMDVFFFPSLYEGLSVSLIEAQSTGLVCIVSENVDKESAVSDLVRFVNINDMTEALKELQNCFDHRDYERNSVIFNQSYDIEKSSAKMLSYYKDNL